MQDHGLFQTICRTNRLDGEDKDFGYIVDYKDLFKKVENAIAVYTSELDHSAGGSDPEILLQDRLKKGKERLDNALEALALLCEPVEPPKGELEHIHYFCGNTECWAQGQRRAWRFPANPYGAAVIGPGEFLTIFCDRNGLQSLCELHSSFTIAGDGTEPITLWGPEAEPGNPSSRPIIEQGQGHYRRDIDQKTLLLTAIL